jgi:hypothetical protein
MNRSIALALVAVSIALTGLSPAAAGSTFAAASPVVAAASPVVDTLSPGPSAVATPIVAVRIAAAAPAPARAPAPGRAAIPATKTVAASSPAATLVSSRTAYIRAMYASVVPSRERAALAGRYVLGYNLPGLACGSGCTGLFSGQARSSFNSVFFSYSLAYQRNTLAHEAAHAYGFLFIRSYATPSWASAGGWQAVFHRLDRSFVRTYDAEAWAACVAWKETGFNNRVDQIRNICTSQAATVAMAQIR